MILKTCIFKRTEESDWEAGLFITAYNNLLIDRNNIPVDRTVALYDLKRRDSELVLDVSAMLKKLQDLCNLGAPDTQIELNSRLCSDSEEAKLDNKHVDTSDIQVWLDGLKAGDEVAVSRPHGLGYTIRLIETITPNRQFKIVGNSNKFDAKGLEIGDKWGRNHIAPVTDEIRKSIVSGSENRML